MNEVNQHQTRLALGWGWVSEWVSEWVSSFLTAHQHSIGYVVPWMSDCLQADKPSQYVTSHSGQLSLAIPPWVAGMSTSESRDMKRHTAWCTSPISVVSQCKLVSSWNGDQRLPIRLMDREGLYLLRCSYTFDTGHGHHSRCPTNSTKALKG